MAASTKGVIELARQKYPDTLMVIVTLVQESYEENFDKFHASLKITRPFPHGDMKIEGMSLYDLIEKLKNASIKPVPTIMESLRALPPPQTGT